MPLTKGFSRQNELTMKIILALCCRKMELCTARWSEFDLDECVWHLPAERIKNGNNIDIPLPAPVIRWLNELKIISGNNQWVLPAKKMQNRMIPHIQESTLPVALGKIKLNMLGVKNFTIHDFRRTARPLLSALSIEPVIAERCLNHKIKGVEGIYNRYQYFAEHKKALDIWRELLFSLENGVSYNVTPLRK